MPTNYPTDGFLYLTGVTFSGGGYQTPGSTLSWTGLSNESDADFDVIDQDDDGRLDQTGSPPDHFNTTTIPFTGYTITIGGFEYGVFDNAGSDWVLPLPVDGTTQSIVPIFGTSNAFQTETSGSLFLCFGAGSLIATPQGETPVEALRIGDQVRVAGGGAVPVRWIGRQTLVKAFAGPKAQLVRIAAGALGNHTDLYVTADHGMVLGGYVVNAGALVDGADIDFVPLSQTPERQVVYHIETEAHDVIFANGAASETYLDIPDRRAFDNFAAYQARYGPERRIRETALPRISSARLLPAEVQACLRATRVA